MKCILLFIAVLGFSTQAMSKVSRDQLDRVIGAFHQAYDSELLLQNELLEINGGDLPLDWYEVSLAHASYMSSMSEEGLLRHDLTIMGGLLKKEYVDPATAVLILCHELGHGLGGTPFKNNDGANARPVSVEGQADYYASLVCVPRVTAYLPQEWIGPGGQNQGLCSQESFQAARICQFLVQGIQGLSDFLKENNPTLPALDLNSQESALASEINSEPTYYPSPQCRIDTLVAGLKGASRPGCWWKAPPAL
jgi:hypothetical protein